MIYWLFQKKSGKHFFLYKSIDLVPKLEISNISASICPICLILDSLDSSQLLVSKSGKKTVIPITNKLFLLSWSYKLKVKDKGLKRFLLYLFYLHLVMGLFASNFRLILCMSTTSRHASAERLQYLRMVQDIAMFWKISYCNYH